MSAIEKYFDAAATHPTTQLALKTFNEASEKYWANSMSLHRLGREAAGAIDQSKQIIATALGLTNPARVSFVPSGTLANQAGISSHPRTRQVYVSDLEHASVHNFLGERPTSTLPLDDEFHIQFPADLRRGSLIIMQHANQLFGTTQSLEPLLKFQKSHWHIDCAQTRDFSSLAPFINLPNVSWAFAPHKIGAVKGAAFVILPENARITSPGDEESARGPLTSSHLGTENVPAICASAMAFLDYTQRASETQAHISSLKAVLVEALEQSEQGFQTLTNPDSNIVAVFHPQKQGQEVMMKLDELGFAVSVSSACDVRYLDSAASPLLKGFANPKNYLRISFHEGNTIESTTALAKAIIGV